MLPFSRAAFLQVFADYNAALWPMSLAFYGLAVAVLALLVARHRLAVPALQLLLAAMWAWTGIAYHILSFSRINGAAFVFGGLFVLQALIFLHRAMARPAQSAAVPSFLPAAPGWSLIAYALVAYPLIGLLAGTRYAELPHFGVSPCPVTLFTLGAMLLVAPVPLRLQVIPVLWSLVGGSAAVLLGIPQDWPLLFSGLAVVPILSLVNRRT